MSISRFLNPLLWAIGLALVWALPATATSITESDFSPNAIRTPAFPEEVSDSLYRDNANAPLPHGDITITPITNDGTPVTGNYIWLATTFSQPIGITTNIGNSLQIDLSNPFQEVGLWLKNSTINSASYSLSFLDQENQVLGSFSGSLAGAVFNDETPEDDVIPVISFFGWQDMGGISRIQLHQGSNSFTSLIYEGQVGAAPVPEPSSLILAGVGLLVLAQRGRKRFTA